MQINSSDKIIMILWIKGIKLNNSDSFYPLYSLILNTFILYFNWTDLSKTYSIIYWKVYWLMRHLSEEYLLICVSLSHFMASDAQRCLRSRRSPSYSVPLILIFSGIVCLMAVAYICIMGPFDLVCLAESGSLAWNRFLYSSGI